jgi:hypothetical protein
MLRASSGCCFQPLWRAFHSSLMRLSLLVGVPPTLIALRSKETG